MSISFPALLIYLLPGFLGLWVFRNIVQEDLNKRGESTQIAVALLLGISAIACLCAANFFLSFWPNVAEYVSPDALQINLDDSRLTDAWSAKFWVSYIMICIFSMASAALWAWLREKNYGATWVLSNWINKCLKRGLRVPCESAMRALIDEMRAGGHEPSLVKVYSLIGDRDTALMGWWNGYSESEKEIDLSLLELCDADTALRKDFDLQPRRCLINHASGIVVEFLDIDEEQAAVFEERARAEYRQHIHPRNL